MRILDIQRGCEYVGLDGEVRVVLAISQRYDAVLQVDWVSRNRRKYGKLLSGQASLVEFARWAVRLIESTET